MLGSQLSLTKSKQLYHLDLDGGKCELEAPDPLLRKYVDYYWLLTIEQPSLLLEIIPDTAVDLVMSPDTPDFAALYFPVSERFSIKLEGPVRYAGVCFRSTTAAELLHLDLSLLTQLESMAETIESLGISPLLADVQSIRSMSDLSECFDTFWLNRHESKTMLDRGRKRISHLELIRVLEDSLGSSSIVSICHTLGVSERQFRRLSKDLFGMSPKKLQNILRLQAALQELFE